MKMRVVRTGTMLSLSFFPALEATEPMTRIVVVDDLWHVFEGGRHTKYRPYEAELHAPAAYLMLSFSELSCLTSEDEMGAAKFEQWRGNIAGFREPLSSEDRSRSEQVLAEVGNMSPSEKKSLNVNAIEKKIATIKRAVADGIRFEVDSSNGVIVTSQTAKLLVAIEDFRWLDKVPDSTFAIPKDVDWDDQTKRWPDADLNECAMVLYDPNFVMAQKQPSLDGYLLNLKTGQLRRLPYQGFGSMPASFLKDRRSVIVSGFDVNGAFDLVRLDLESGENTRLSRRNGFSMGGEMSPDGKSMGAIDMFASKGVTDFQISVVNLETGISNRIGEPSRWGGPFSWLPDGSGIILKRFERANGFNGIEPRVICRMDLNGNHTDILSGDSPLVLRKSNRILFQDNGTRLWHTCAFDGTQVELFGDGFKRHGTPAVSPDETRVLFNSFSDGEVPQLLLYEVGSGKGAPATKAPGFLSQPVWR